MHIDQKNVTFKSQPVQTLPGIAQKNTSWVERHFSTTSSSLSWISSIYLLYPRNQECGCLFNR